MLLQVNTVYKNEFAVWGLTAGVLHFSSVSVESISVHSALPTVTVAFWLKPKPLTVSRVPPEEKIKQ